MDIQTALCDLLDAMHRNDREAVDELLDAIKESKLKGGYLPTVEKVNGLDGLFQVSRNS